MGNCWPKQYFCGKSTTRAMMNGNESPPVPPPSSGGGGGAAPPPHAGTINMTPDLKRFSLAELRSATRDFRADSMIGEGGFGKVFRGYVDEKSYAPSKAGIGIPVAVKKSNADSEQGHKEWQAEVNFLGRFRHPNLVKLLGYCWEDTNFLLVYEYMPRGSLETHLFRMGAAEPIPWDTRVKIAIGAARGLAFLHSTGQKQVIYRDFKASNILLDGVRIKLSDFGLAKLGPLDGNSHVTTQIVGTYGYAAPEYVATGHLYVKSDVYGFGVVLLELITGLRVLDHNRPNGQVNLVEWAKPILPNKKKLQVIIDPGLEGKYSSKGVYKMAELILLCLKPNPKHRPGMDEVWATLEQISTIKMKSKKLEADSKEDRRHCRHLSPHHGRDGARGNMVHSPFHDHQRRGGGRGNMVGPLPQNTLNVGRR